MNSYFFALVLCFLSVIDFFECGYNRHRRDYRPRLSYDYYDGDNGDNDYDTDYPSYYPGHHPKDYSRHYPPIDPTFNAGRQKRGPQTRASIIGIKNSDYARQECLQPLPEPSADKMYKHPRNESCYVTYKKGEVYCFDREDPEPPIIMTYAKERKKNPLYHQICKNVRPLITTPCYTPDERMFPEQKNYLHPNNGSCVVSYDNGTVSCNGILQEPTEPNSNGDDLYTPLYQVLCTTYCRKMLPELCKSTQALPCTVCVGAMVTENGCYSPEANKHIGRVYAHPRNHWNESCVVTYNEGDIYCHGRQKPEPRRIPDPEYIMQPYQHLNKEVLNPLYKQICPKTVARTTMPCYTPPAPTSPLERHYQHPTSRHCLVSYDSGDIICDNVLQERSIDSDGREVDAPLYRELCSFYCHSLLPIQCVSIRPKSCTVCDGFDES